MTGRRKNQGAAGLFFTLKGYIMVRSFPENFEDAVSTGFFSEHAARRSCQDRGTCVPAGKTDRMNVYPGGKI